MSRLAPRVPRPGARFVAHRGRLALFHDASEAQEYWGGYWLTDQTRGLMQAAHEGTLDSGFDVFVRVINRLLPIGARVLEGGCGPGHVVAALGHRGYTATGLDYVQRLVEFANNTMPDLDIRWGDVEALPFEDESFDCYASLGVVEHLELGPQRAILEGRRVVRPGGLAIFEVPYLNPLRRRHLAQLRDAGHADGLAFHQYYFDAGEFRGLLEAGGFSVLESIPGCWESVIFREHPVVSRFWTSRLAISALRPALRRLVARFPPAGQLRYAHTMTFACRRT